MVFVPLSFQVAKPSAEYSAENELRNLSFAALSDGGVIFVGRCRDGGGAEDQKIAACGNSYRGVVCPVWEGWWTEVTLFAGKPAPTGIFGVIRMGD